MLPKTGTWHPEVRTSREGDKASVATDGRDIRGTSSSIPTTNTPVPPQRIPGGRGRASAASVPRAPRVRGTLAALALPRPPQAQGCLQRWRSARSLHPVLSIPGDSGTSPARIAAGPEGPLPGKGAARFRGVLHPIRQPLSRDSSKHVGTSWPPPSVPAARGPRRRFPAGSIAHDTLRTGEAPGAGMAPWARAAARPALSAIVVLALLLAPSPLGPGRASPRGPSSRSASRATPRSPRTRSGPRSGAGPAGPLDQATVEADIKALHKDEVVLRRQAVLRPRPRRQGVHPDLPGQGDAGPQRRRVPGAEQGLAQGHRGEHRPEGGRPRRPRPHPGGGRPDPPALRGEGLRDGRGQAARGGQARRHPRRLRDLRGAEVQGRRHRLRGQHRRLRRHAPHQDQQPPADPRPDPRQVPQGRPRRTPASSSTTTRAWASSRPRSPRSSAPAPTRATSG